MVDKNLSTLQAFVATDLQRMDLVIKTLLTDKEPLIPTLANYIIFAGGKRLRPILTILTAKMFGYQGEKHINLAAAIEFIHTATLLHDDVIDESNLRRGVTTANSKWGSKASILVGDFLLSQAFHLMVQNESMKVLGILAHVSSRISEGEVRQLVASQNICISEQDYIEIIGAKTAILFAAACQIGAVINDRTLEEEQALYDFGLNLGIAFQIMDDALDYSSSQELLGKNIGDDYREGKVTLPVIIAYRESNVEDKAFWERTFKVDNQHTADLQTAISLIAKYDAFNLAIARATEYVAKASLQLELFEDSEVKTILTDILSFCLQRSH